MEQAPKCACGTCKYCKNREYTRRYRERHPERRRESQRRYDAANKDKARDYYQANSETIKARSSAWRKANPDQKRENNRRWREANREKARASIRMHAKRYPDKIVEKVQRRRALKARVVVEDFARAEIFDRDGGVCRYCSRPADPKNWHLAHLVSLANGGAHSRANVAVSCPDCNLRDGTGRISVQMHLAA